MNNKLSAVTAVLLCLTLITCGGKTATTPTPMVNSALELSEANPEPAPPQESTRPNNQNTGDAGHDHADHDHESDDHAENQHGKIASSGYKPKTELINLTDRKDEDYQDWTAQAESLIVDRQSDILTVVYPVGKFVREARDDEWTMPFNVHERIITQDQVESLLSQIENWMKRYPCIDKELRQEELTEYRKYFEKGGDTSTQRTLCKNARLLLMAMPQFTGNSSEDERMPDWDAHYFLVHELYHAFQQDLFPPEDCQEKVERAIDESPHGGFNMVEGGADYFAYFLTAKNFSTRGISSIKGAKNNLLHDVQRTYREEGTDSIRGSATAAAGLLLLLIERGELKHETIMDGSLFHDCARNTTYALDSPAVSSALNTWNEWAKDANANNGRELVKGNSDDGIFKFNPSIETN